MEATTKLQYHLVNNNGQTTCYIHNNAGDTIAVMRRDDAPSTKIQGQWAKEIVNRYNTHDSLVEALKEITRQYQAIANEYSSIIGINYKEDDFNSIVVAKQLLNKLEIV